MPNGFTLDNLRRYRGYALVLAFVASCLVHLRAPPDVAPMVIMAVSLYLLYEVGLFVAGLLAKR